MFKLNEKYEVNRNILKCDNLRYSPSGKTTSNTAKSQKNINIPREVSVIFLLNSFFDLNFDVVHAATKNRYANGDDIRLNILGPIGSFGNYKLATSSEKHLEDINHTHVASLIYKLIASAKDFDDISVGFDRDRNKRQQELTYNKIIQGKYHVGVMLRDILGFAEHQKKGDLRLLDATRLWIKQFKPTMLKLKLVVFNGMYRIIRHQSPDKLYYLNKV